jgi:hypothetical protein
MEEPLCLPEETEQAFKKHEMPILAEAYGCIMGAVGTVTDGALERELGKRWGKRTARKIAKEIEERLIFDIGALIGEAAIRTANIPICLTEDKPLDTTTGKG